MRILTDIVHPAHVHFYKNILADLQQRGHKTLVVARNKEVTTDLLSQLGIEHVAVGQPSKLGRVGQLAELAHRNVTLARWARRFEADLIMTRNPAGVQAARLTGRIGVFDTDDGLSAGIHFKAARPFAHYITSPDCLPEYMGPNHVRYPGYKQSAYLHPDHFTPDRSVLQDLGLRIDEPFFIVRFVAMLASHDTGHAGMSTELKRTVIERLQVHGRVYLSSEGPVPAEWQHLAYRLPPHRIHDLLAFAQLVVGDSGTVPAEAAVLGTPAIHVSTYAGKIRYLNEMESKYGLAWSYDPNQSGEMLNQLDSLLKAGDCRGAVSAGYKRLLSEKINVAKWYVEFLERIGATG